MSHHNFLSVSVEIVNILSAHRGSLKFYFKKILICNLIYQSSSLVKMTKIDISGGDLINYNRLHIVSKLTRPITLLGGITEHTYLCQKGYYCPPF